MAKRAGMKVEEFGFGLPPRMAGFKFKKNGTLYSLNWIPFGGFVRIYGSDSNDPKYLKSNVSFVGKRLSQRIKVVIAGVVMNLFLAWILFSVGFAVGMQPFVTADSFEQMLNDGEINLSHQLVIDSPGEVWQEKGLGAGDKLISFQDAPLDKEVFTSLLSGEDLLPGRYTFEKNKTNKQVIVELSAASEDLDFAIGFDSVGLFNHPKVFDLDPSSVWYQKGLRTGDIIYRVNDKTVFSAEDFFSLVKDLEVVEIQHFNGKELLETEVVIKDPNRIMVTEVAKGSAAEKAGLNYGDLIMFADGQQVYDVQQFISIVSGNEGPINYVIERNGELFNLTIAPKEGKIGVGLSNLVSSEFEPGLNLFDAFVPVQIDVKEEKHVWYKAIFRSLQEMKVATAVTVDGFSNFITSFLTTGQVPDGITGTVGMVQVTHSLIDKGVIHLLRFAAMLSLTLAILNILPIPALDGGRLMFLIYEGFRGRRVNQKAEGFVHFVGFVFLLFLIVVVTYNDIVNIFG